MGTQRLLGSTMILATVIVHVAGLVSLAAGLQRAAPRLDRLARPLKAISLLIPSVLLILFLHVVEAWGWALMFLRLGEFSSLEAALHFSTVSATTLGYGDVTLSESWRLLAAFEAMGGLVLFAASTAFLLALTRSVLDETLADSCRLVPKMSSRARGANTFDSDPPAKGAHRK